MPRIKKMLKLTNPPDVALKPMRQQVDTIIYYIQGNEKFMYIKDCLIKIPPPFQIFPQLAAQINLVQFLWNVDIGLHHGVFIGEKVMHPIRCSNSFNLVKG